MNDKLSNFMAGLLLGFMFLLMVSSAAGDSTTMDEMAHLPSGYSYIVKQDMRLNPEHPPLMKDLAGLGALAWSKLSGQPINFPEQIKAWREDLNGQWDFGFNFLYQSGNNARKMIFWGRFPLILLTIILGLYIFKWARQLFGNRTALLALALFALSPTFIAHGRLVTTDVAASLAIFVGLYYFVRWLKDPSWKKLIAAGIFFGLAQLMKFSVFLLVPLFIFLAISWIIAQRLESKKDFVFDKDRSFLRLIVKYLGGLVLIAAIGYIFIVGPAYQYHVWHYEKQKQTADTEEILSTYAKGPAENGLGACLSLRGLSRCPAEIVTWMSGQSILRAWAQYGLGLLMVTQRSAGGNTTYFLGQINNTGWWYYFPVVYLLKEPLALHLLSAIALLLALIAFLRSPFWKKPLLRLFEWINQHLAEFAMLSFLALYWLMSVRSTLNIGVRHVLPTFPFVYILSSNQIIKWLKIKLPKNINDFLDLAKKISGVSIKTVAKYGLVAGLLCWQFITVVLIYPHYLAYFNELAGGPKGGYRYAVDSNLDWGQDLIRLDTWLEKHRIDKIYLNYFGGSSPEYFLGDKYLVWWGERQPEEMTESQYLAVSATFLQGGRGKFTDGFSGPDEGVYRWLDQYKPVIAIGHSIFVYKIE